MKRKVNRVGQNTLTVSLPRKWAEQYSVKQGMELDVEDEGAILKFKAVETKEERKIEFHLADSSSYMERLVCSPFLKGYNNIEFKYDDPHVYPKILGSLKHTIGFEVIEQKEGYCRVGEISKGSGENFSNLINRLFHITCSFAKEIKRFLKNKDQNFNELLDIEYACDKIALYCRRSINNNIVSGKTYDNTGVYNIVCLLERVGDELRQIIDFFQKQGFKNFSYDTGMDKLFDNLDTSLDVIMKKMANYLGKRDVAKQVELALQQRNLKKEIDTLKNELFRTKSENILITHHLINIFEHIQHMSEELF